MVANANNNDSNSSVIYKNGVGYVTELRNQDVLLGRGSGPNDHEGNVRFRQYVNERKNEYNTTNHRVTKTRIAREVVQKVLFCNGMINGSNNDSGGRFLKKLELKEAIELQLPTESNPFVTYYEIITEEAAMDKAKQALRQQPAGGGGPVPNSVNSIPGQPMGTMGMMGGVGGYVSSSSSIQSPLSSSQHGSGVGAGGILGYEDSVPGHLNNRDGSDGTFFRSSSTSLHSNVSSSADTVRHHNQQQLPPKVTNHRPTMEDTERLISNYEQRQQQQQRFQELQLQQQQKLDFVPNAMVGENPLLYPSGILPTSGDEAYLMEPLSVLSETPTLVTRNTRNSNSSSIQPRDELGAILTNLSSPALRRQQYQQEQEFLLLLQQQQHLNQNQQQNELEQLRAIQQLQQQLQQRQQLQQQQQNSSLYTNPTGINDSDWQNQLDLRQLEPNPILPDRFGPSNPLADDVHDNNSNNNKDPRQQFAQQRGSNMLFEDYDDDTNNDESEAGLSNKSPLEVLISKLEDETPAIAALDDGAMSAEKLRRQQMFQQQVSNSLHNSATLSEHDDDDHMAPLPPQFSFQSTNTASQQQQQHQNRRMNSLSVNDIFDRNPRIRQRLSSVNEGLGHRTNTSSTSSDVDALTDSMTVMSVDATLTPLNNNNPTPTNYTTSSSSNYRTSSTADMSIVSGARRRYSRTSVASADTIPTIDPYAFHNNSSMMNDMSFESSFFSMGHNSSMLMNDSNTTSFIFGSTANLPKIFPTSTGTNNNTATSKTNATTASIDGRTTTSSSDGSSTNGGLSRNFKDRRRPSDTSVATSLSDVWGDNDVAQQQQSQPHDDNEKKCSFESKTSSTISDKIVNRVRAQVEKEFSSSSTSTASPSAPNRDTAAA